MMLCLPTELQSISIEPAAIIAWRLQADVIGRPLLGNPSSHVFISGARQLDQDLAIKAPQDALAGSTNPAARCPSAANAAMQAVRAGKGSALDEAHRR